MSTLTVTVKVGPIPVCFCKTIRWANTGRDIWNANILQEAPYFYILQPPQQDNKRSLPKEFWTRLMVMDFCNNKQTNKKWHMSNCSWQREITEPYLAWIFHIRATEQEISVSDHTLPLMSQHDDTAPYPENCLHFIICPFTYKNTLISKAYTCSDTQRFIWASITHFWYYLIVTNSSQRHFWFLFSLFYTFSQ